MKVYYSNVVIQRITAPFDKRYLDKKISDEQFNKLKEDKTLQIIEYNYNELRDDGTHYSKFCGAINK